MVNPQTEICICNDLTLEDIAKYIREYNLSTLEEILDNKECSIGNKCESCLDEGFNNDGLNIPMVLTMVKKELI
jgi:bacterioferritin-associated ferredoxin